MDNLSFASHTYLRLKSLWRGQKYSGVKRTQVEGRTSSVPYAKGRDPKALSAVLGSLTEHMGWTQQLSQSLLLTEWTEFVGEGIAHHTEVMSIERGVLHIQCDSTPWATQLRRMRHQIMTKLHEQYPDAGIEDITFHGPHTPSWRHGYRTVAGRGPRDTYG